MNLFKQIKTKDEQPGGSGWYNTDKGKLFWVKAHNTWSCRADRISEEYPEVWYKPIDASSLNQSLMAMPNTRTMTASPKTKRLFSRQSQKIFRIFQ